MALTPVYNNPPPLTAGEIPTRAQDEKGVKPFVAATIDPGPPTRIESNPALPYPTGSPQPQPVDPYPIARLPWEEAS